MSFVRQTSGSEGDFGTSPATHIFLILIPAPSQAIFCPKASDATAGISITIIATRNALKSGAKTHTKPIWCRIQLKEQLVLSHSRG